jgi:hypothetical protein
VYLESRRSVSRSESGNRALTDIVAASDAALRLASFETLARLLLPVRGEGQIERRTPAGDMRITISGHRLRHLLKVTLDRPSQRSYFTRVARELLDQHR